MSKTLIISLNIIFIAFITGYILQKLEQRNIIRLPLGRDKFRKLLQKIALLIFLPISTIGTLWVIKIENIKLAALPFLSILAILLGGVFGLIIAKILKLDRKDTGSIFTCGSFTNSASIGGLICYVFLGEAGFALSSLYRLFIPIIFFGFGFPIAKSFSRKITSNNILLLQLRSILKDVFVLVGLLSIVVGMLFNISGIKRPVIYQDINAISIPGSTILLLISIGLAMKFGKVKKYIREGIAVSVIKYFLLPVIISSIAFLLGYGGILGGLPLKVVIILSSMPVAFTALIPVSIYDLNLDLANSCWLVTNLALIIYLPILFYIINLF